MSEIPTVIYFFKSTILQSYRNTITSRVIIRPLACSSQFMSSDPKINRKNIAEMVVVHILLDFFLYMLQQQ